MKDCQVRILSITGEAVEEDKQRRGYLGRHVRMRGRRGLGLSGRRLCEGGVEGRDDWTITRRGVSLGHPAALQ